MVAQDDVQAADGDDGVVLAAAAPVAVDCEVVEAAVLECAAAVLAHVLHFSGLAVVEVAPAPWAFHDVVVVLVVVIQTEYCPVKLPR